MTHKDDVEAPDFDFWKGILSVRTGAAAIALAINRRRFAHVVIVATMTCLTAIATVVGVYGGLENAWSFCAVMILSAMIVAVGFTCYLFERKIDGQTRKTGSDEPIEPGGYIDSS